MENPIKMDDLGVPIFLETPTFLLTILVFKGGFCNWNLEHASFTLVYRINLRRRKLEVKTVSFDVVYHVVASRTYKRTSFANRD